MALHETLGKRLARLKSCRRHGRPHNRLPVCNEEVDNPKAERQLGPHNRQIHLFAHRCGEQRLRAVDVRGHAARVGGNPRITRGAQHF